MQYQRNQWLIAGHLWQLGELCTDVRFAACWSLGRQWWWWCHNGGSTRRLTLKSCVEHASIGPSSRDDLRPCIRRMPRADYVKSGDLAGQRPFARLAKSGRRDALAVWLVDDRLTTFVVGVAGQPPKQNELWKMWMLHPLDDLPAETAGSQATRHDFALCCCSPPPHHHTTVLADRLLTSPRRAVQIWSHNTIVLISSNKTLCPFR